MSLNYTEEELNYTAHIQQIVDDIASKCNFSAMLFGIIANTLCISVFYDQVQLRKKFQFYLLALAFADLFYCILVFLNYLVFIVNPPNVLYDFSYLTCHLTDYSVGIIDSYCILLTLILSVDRLYAITSPLKFRNSITYRFPKMLIFTCIGLVALLKSPEIFLSQLSYEIDTESFNNQSNYTNVKPSYICTSKSAYSQGDQERPLGYFLYIYVCNIILPVLLNLIPAVVILVLNLMLWFFIRNYNMETKKESKTKIRRTTSKTLSSTQKSHYFTIIILGIWLLVTTVPYYLFKLNYWFLVVSDRENSDLTTLKFLIRQGISSVFFNLNHCLNIIIYIIFHRDFQRKLLANFIMVFNFNPFVSINQEALFEQNFNDKKKTEQTALNSATTTNLISKESKKKIFTMKRNFHNCKNKSHEEKTVKNSENDEILEDW